MSSPEEIKQLTAIEDTLKEILFTLKGSTGMPGVVKRLESVEAIIHGTDENPIGLNHMTRVMWRVHVWLLCSLSALLSSIATWVIFERILKK